MNKLRYRIVFNQTRGMCMAVAETARSQGKGAGREGGSGVADGTVPAALRMPALRRMAWLLALGLGGWTLAAGALAQVVADPRAPGQQRATVLSAGNGVLQVNVQTPSAAGVSRNVYTQFDVPKSGVILNNSRTNVQSQLGGWVQANPWMTQGAAKVILNEVNSSNPSRLQGYVEVAGDRAETVIANPAGIVVDGGGFINVSRVTLTTGTPLLDDGRLTGYSVQRGQVVVEGAGLDARTTDYTALIARSVQVNAGLWAQRLNVVAGVNEVADGGDTPTARAGQASDAAPLYAIDVARLGGMYANHIYLVGTEAGVGVRNAGEIGAAAGDLVVTASGRLENTGTLSASAQLQAQAAAIENHGTIAATRLELAAAALRNDGSIVQTGGAALAIEATQVRNTGGTLGRDDTPAAATPANDAAAQVAPAPATGTGSSAIAAGTGAGTATGAAAASGSATAPAASPAAPAAAAAPVLVDGTLAAPLLDNTNGTIVANGGVALRAAQFDNHGGHAYLDSLAVSGPAFDNTAGALTVLRGFTARTDSFVNDQGKLLVGAIFDAASGSFSNRQGLVQAGRLAVDAAAGLDNTGGILRQMGSARASVAAGGELALEQGLVDVAGDLDVRAGTIGGSGSTLNVTGNLSVRSGAASAVKGTWLAGADATLATGDFDNRGGTLSAAGKVDMRTGALGNAGGTIAAGTDVAIAAKGAVDNAGGIVQATRDLALAATGGIGNGAGTIETLGSHSRMDVSAAGIDNAGGRIANAGDGKTTVRAQDTVDNTGLIGGNGDVAIGARTVRNATGGRVVSVGDMDVAASALLSNAGSIGAGGSFGMAQDGAQLVNRGTLVAARDIDIDTAGVDNSGGTIATEAGRAGAIGIATGSLANRGGTIQADGSATLVVRRGVDNLQGQVRSGGDLALDAGGRIENGAGAIVSAGTMQVHGGEIGNQGGTISAAGIGDSRVAAERSIDNGGLIGANGSLDLEADTLDNNAAGLVNSGGHLDLAVHGRLTNAGTISSAGGLTSDERRATWINTGTVSAAGAAALDLDRVENAGGTIATLQGADLALKANGVGNQGGRLMAGANAALQVTGSVDNSGGVLQAAGSLDAGIGAALVNRNGVVEALGAHGTLGVRAGSIDNTDGRIVNVGDGAAVIAAAGHIENSGLIAGNGRLDLGAATMNNTGTGTVSAGKQIELAVSGALANAGTISAATGLHSEQADAVVRNSGTIVSGGALAMTVKAIDNGGGRIATAQDSHADMLLSAQNISNQGGAIMVDRDAAFLVKDGFDNRNGLVQAKGHMRLDAGGLVDTSAGSIETLSGASTLAVHAGALVNDAGRIVNAGSGDMAVRADTTLVNSGQIAGNGALQLEAQEAVNGAQGTIAAGGALALQVHARLENAGSIGSHGAMQMDEAQAAIVNRGSIVAGADVAIRAGAVDNDGGTLATATGSGASLTLQGASLSNRGGIVVAEHALALDVAGALDNSRGTLQGVDTVRVTAGATLVNDGGVLEATGAAATLDVRAQAIHNDGGRIVDVGNGAATIGAVDSIMNSGLVAGNGTLALDAATLANTASGTIASGAAMTVAVGAHMDNAGTVNSGATLDIAAQGATVRNSGLVVAQDALALASAAFDNDGGQLATAKGGGAGVRIDATSVSNRAGTILADRDAQVHSQDGIDNSGGTLQAGGALDIEAGGTLANDAGVIEALDPAATLALHAGRLDNGNGRIVNVGSEATEVTVDGALSSRGLVAGNGAVTMAVGTLDNQAGGSIAAGTTLDLAAATHLANAGAISSHDALTLAASAASVRNSGQIVSGAGATLDTGDFDNSGGQVATVQGSGGAIALHAASLVNAGGAIVADGDAAVTVAGDADNRQGTLHAAGSLAIDAGGSVRNDAGTIEVTGTQATLDVRAAAVDNGTGHLLNVGSGATRIAADGDIRNAGTLAGNGSVDLVAATIHNDAGGTVATGGTLDLHAAQSLDNTGKISAAAALTMDQAAARIANTGQLVAGGRILLHGASIANDGGQIATQSGADVVLDSEGQLGNRGGVVAAAGNATIDAGAAYDNSQGQVQAQGRLQATAGGALLNNGGALEAVGSASTLAVQAASLDNTAGRIVNAGSGRTTIDSAASIVNSGTIAANGAMDIASLTLQNRSGGTIGAGGALELGVRQQFSNLGGTVSSGGTLHFDQAAASFVNSGRIGAGGTATVTAATIDNNGGQLYTVQQSGAAILLHGASLSNGGGTIAADGLLVAASSGSIANNAGTLHAGSGADIDAGTTLDNGSGTIETAAGLLDIDARSIASSGRIVNAGSGATTLTSATGIVNSGTIAGNGTLDLHAATLQNLAGGQVASGAALLVDVRQQWTNAGTVSSGGTLRFDQAGAAFSNSGQVASRGDAVFRAASFNNDGGKISTVDGSGADISVTAPALSNRGGAILADGDATFAFSGSADNSQGTLQAGANLALTTPGNIANAGGTIEAIGTASTLTLDGAAIDNGSGRITNAGSGDTRLTSRANIVNNGTIAAMGNLLLSGQALQNQSAGTIASGRNMDLAITQQLANQGKVNSGGTLTFNQAGATFANSGQVFAGGTATIVAKVVDNNGGQLGTGSGSGADLALTSEQLSNQGGRIATDRDLAVNTHAVTAMGELFGGRDLALTMDGDYVQDAGSQQFHSNRDLSLTVTGNITNTSTFGAVGTLSLSGQQIVNQAGASIEGQGVVIKASGNLDNAGEINGQGKLDIGAANVSNTGGIVGGNVTLATGNLDNTGAAALIGATGTLGLGVSGTLNNTGNATLYSSGDMTIGAPGGAGTVNNISSTIEAGGSLALNASTLNNVRQNIVIEHVKTADETTHMSLPSWYTHGDNHESFETSAANYLPREVYFVSPSDVLEDEIYVTPDGYTIHRAVIKTHANDSAFFIASSGLHTAYGIQERMTLSEGTKVIYYTSGDPGQANPDQGGPANNLTYLANTVTHWNSTVSYSNQYGNCSTDCIRMVTQPGYDDPRTTLLRDHLRALESKKEKLEVSREAHHTATEDRLAPGAGAAAQILSGGNMQLTVGSALNNEYGDIKAKGTLAVGGGAAIRNVGVTLYSVHTFDGTWRTEDGQTVSYQEPSISTILGAAGGVIEGQQGVNISGRSFSNVDVSAGTVGNVRDAVNVIGSGASGASSAGSHATSGAGSGGNAGGAVSGSAPGAHAAVAGAASALGGSSGLAASLRAAASGVANGLQAGGSADGSGYANDAATGADATSSGIANGSATAGMAGQSGASNDARLKVGVTASANGTQLGNVANGAGPAAGQSAAGVHGAGLGSVMQVAPSGLFIKSPDASGSYLFETRPQFANQQQWTSSDYLLNQLALDPATTQKRLGDGFYEQRLVREQLSELTGHDSSAGASDDSVYKQLLANAVSAAQEFGLRPGVALSADQVGRLTSDIVWMESQTVMLPDGSTETVLVPQVYLAHVGQEAVKPSGALVTGNGVSINVTDSIVNQGGVIDGGNGRTVLVAGQDIVNAGGTIKGGAVALKADGDIRNESLAVKETYDFGPNSGSYTSLSNVATIASTGTLDIMAGRDLVDLAGKIGAGTNATLSAGGNIDFGTIQTGSTYQSQIAGVTEQDSSIAHQLSQIGTGGNLTIAATGNLNLTGTQVSIGTAGSGAGQLLAGGSINIAAVTNEVNTSVQNDPGVKQYDKQIHENQTVVGAGIASAGDLTVAAGIGSKGDLNVTGSVIAGGGTVVLSATNDVKIANATESHLSDTAIHRESSGLLKSSSSTATDHSASTLVVGSGVSGNNVVVKSGNDISIAGSALTATDALALDAARDLTVTSVASTNSEDHTHDEKKSGFSIGSGGIGYAKSTQNQASNGDTVTQVGSMLSGGSVAATSGRDTLIQGSTVVADNDIGIHAGRDLSIVSAENSVDEASASSTKKSGMIGSFTQPAIGTVKTTQDGTRDAVTQVGSQIASLDGNVTLTAGNKYTQTASDILAQTGDIGIGAKDVLINAGVDTSNGTDHSTYSKTAIGGTVSVPLVDAIKTVSNMVDAAKDTGDTRMKALAALNSAAALKDAPTSVEAIQNAGIRVSVSLGSTKSESNTVTTSTTAVGSTINAGGNVTIVATGDGKNSNLTAIGSDISASQNVNLLADNQVNLLAAENTASQHSTNKSSGSSIGVGFGIGGTSNGFSIDLAVSKAHGNADGDDLTYTNTHVSGGSNITLVSGGDTTLKGGVISGNTVVADIGGNLNIESLQDRSTFESKQTSAGLNASLCIPPFCYGVSTVGGSFGKSNVNGDYLSVQEQSGIKAGDGGFQVSVGGNTDLKGGVLSSSQAAIDRNNNLLITGTLTASDLVNKDEHNASGFSLSGSVSGKLGDQSNLPKDLTGAQQSAASTDGKPGASGGFGSVSGSQSGVTLSGISGATVVITDQPKQLETGKSAEAVLAALDRSVTSDSTDSAGSLVKAWDAQQLQKDIDAQVAISQKFSTQAPKAIADFATAKVDELKAQGASAEEIAKWEEGGVYRVALHAASGGLTGGVSGAVGAGVVAESAKLLDALQMNAEVALVQQGVSPEAAKALAQSLAELTAIGVGAAAGGEAGAATGLATDTNNRQLHQTEYDFAKKYAKLVADKLKISEKEAEGRIVAEILRNSDKQVAAISDGKHDYDVRALLGCQNLNCNGYRSDGNYSNVGYNSQYISQNQATFENGVTQMHVGMTYNELVSKNVSENKISVGIAGVGMVVFGRGIGGGLATPQMAGIGGAIGASANGVAQFGNGQEFDWTSLGAAGVTGAASTGLGLSSSLFINVGGSLATSAIKGENPNSGMVTAGVGTILGYGVGTPLESKLDKISNPWYRPEWESLGLGLSSYIPKSTVPSWVAGYFSSGAQEGISPVVQKEVEKKQ